MSATSTKATKTSKKATGEKKSTSTEKKTSPVKEVTSIEEKLDALYNLWDHFSSDLPRIIAISL